TRASSSSSSPTSSTYWWTESSCCRAGPRSPTGWRKPVTRNGAKRKPPSPRRSPDGNCTQGRGRYRLQGEVRLLRPRGIRLQGQARPEPERKFLAGVSAQYESEVVYHSLQEELTKKGVIFTDTDSALRDHPDLFKEYFGTVIPPADNKFSALNTAVWSGGSFIYVPKGVRVDIPLQAYFRINAENMGQFERTLIICDEGSFVHYIEGCTAPIYTTDSLHSAVVEIIVKKDARCRYTTIQN